MALFGLSDGQFSDEKENGFVKCKRFNEHKYRVFQSYFGKFFDVSALCDTPYLEFAELIVKVLSEYHKDRPFDYFIGVIDTDDK